jgi:tetratricopeptide (TPR) repeat protein
VLPQSLGRVKRYHGAEIAASSEDVCREEMRFCFPLVLGCVVTFLSAGAEAETVERSPADRQYTFAQGLYRQGFFDLAAGQFEKFAEVFPQDERREGALFLAAESYYQAGKDRRDAAVAALRKYQKEYSGSTSQYSWTSFYLVGELEFQRAEELQSEEAATGEERMAESVRLALEDSLAAYQRCAALAPPRSKITAAALSKAAYCASKLKKWDQSAEAYQRLADATQSAQAQFMAGEAFSQWGAVDPAKFSDAIRAYKRVGLFGDNALEDDAAVSLAWCLYRQGKPGECGRLLEKQIGEGLFSRVDRDFKQEVSKLPEAYYLLGVCSSELGDRVGGVKWFRLLARYPKHPLRREALARMGELLGGNVDPTTDEGAEIAYAVGWSLMGQDKVSEAAAAFERVYRSYPKMATAAFRDELRYDWGVCYERLGYYREALGILGYLSRASSDPVLRAKAARLEARCHQKAASETQREDLRDSEELEAVAALKRYADEAVGAPAEDALGEVGDFYYGRKMYAVACEVYEEFLSRYPRSGLRSRILFRLGLCYLETRDRARAVSLLERCRIEFPSRLEAVYATEQLAGVYTQWSEYSKALAEYSKLEPADFPGLSAEELEVSGRVFENAAYARGILHEKMGDPAGAVAEWEVFLLQFPRSGKVPRARLRLAKLCSDQGRHEESIRALKLFVDEPGKYAETETALTMLVHSSLELGRGAEAMAYVKKVLESPLGESLPANLFTRVSRRMEEAEDAEGARFPYVFLIERQRKLHNAMITAAGTTREMVEKKEYAKAIEYCADMFAIHAPEQVSGQNAEEENRKAALICLSGLEELRVRTRSELRSAYWQLGELNLRLGDPAAAAAAFESLAAVKPPAKQHFEVLHKAGMAWQEAGDFEKAMEDFETIVRFASRPEDNLRAQLSIGDLWLAWDKADRSLGTYLRIVNFYDSSDPAVRPWVARALLQSGIAFQRLGRPAEAGRQFATLAAEFGAEEEYAAIVKDARSYLEGLGNPTKEESPPSS